MVSDIFMTFATDFLTEAPALEHLLRNSARPNCEAPVLRSLQSTFDLCLKLCALVAGFCGVLPKVEAPEGLGCGCGAIGGCGCFGLVPEVVGGGEECGVFVAGDVLEPELGG